MTKSFTKIIYSDGSSLGNPGRGGYAVVALDTEKSLVWEYGGAERNATNNQMELLACLTALEIILKSKSDHFELRLDSQYVVKGITEWSKGWLKNNWKNAQKKPVVNKEMWIKILELIKEINGRGIKLKWTHVYGHNGEEWNERCDEIARGLAGGEDVRLRKGEKY